MAGLDPQGLDDLIDAIMDKVVSISDRREGKKRKEQAQAHKHRIETIQRVVHCSLCKLKCAMCGEHLGDAPGLGLSCPPSPSPPDLNLCPSCQAEFEAFMKVSKEKEVSDLSWHNSEWAKLWSAWLDYHKAIGDYRASEEFKELSTDLDS